MTALITDPALEQRLIKQRRRTGEDRFDEIWDGVYVMAPMPNNEHQRFAHRIAHVLTLVIEDAGLGTIYPGANVSDQKQNWTKNYRCPDVLVFLKGNPAEDRDTHWFGGPDLAIEVVSPGDRSYEKLDFYAKVNTREVLIVDRDPWQLVLFRQRRDKMIELGRSTLQDSAVLDSSVVPLRFKLSAVRKKPQIEILHTEGKQRWIVKSSV
jgi:Uma2 family endonuclease